MICDAHIHYIPQELSACTSFYKGIWADKGKLFSYLEENRISKALLTYPSTDAHFKLGQKKVCRVYNQLQKKLVKENPKIIAAGLIDLDDLSQASNQIAYLKKEGFGALSLPSSYRGKFLVKELAGVFQEAQKQKLPIFVHSQTINPIGFERSKDPLLMPVLEYSFDTSMFMGLLMVEGVFQNYSLNFIFSSLGGVVPFLKERFDRVYSMLRQRNLVKDLGVAPSQILRRVYVDASGASLEKIKMALGLFGAERILWGSDYPVCGNLEKSLETLKSLEKETKEKIKSKNFLTLFNQN